MQKILFLFLVVMLSGCGLTDSFGKSSKPSNEAPQKQQNQTRTIGQTASDIRISAGIHLDLVALKLYKPITVTVKRGYVTYTGTVPTERDSFIAVGVAWKQNGVKKVINNLKVAK